MKTPKKILVIRNDKIGDFMLAWPAFALLKKQYPEVEITALVPEYTAPLARHCIWIDKVLIDTKSDSLLKDIFSLSDKIKPDNYDLSISLFLEMRTSFALWLAGIPERIGPATKLAQIFINKPLRQKRSQSKKPEYEYNLDLIKHYIKLRGDTPTTPNSPPFLYFAHDEITKLRIDIQKKYSILDNSKIVIVHPGTGGSAINLSIQQYANLILELSNYHNCYFLITAGPSEENHAEELSNKIKNVKHHIYNSNRGIINFCKLLNICDIFISGSTGPLHISGAMNLQTVAFYPAKKSATSLRWQTINDECNRISFMPEDFKKHDMSTIDIKKCAAIINKRYLTLSRT